MDSELKSQGRPAGRQPVPVCVIPYSEQSEEISLIDLWRIVVARKMIVLLSLLLALVLATAYVFLAEPSYRAEANLLPPQRKDIQALMVNYHGKGSLMVDRYTPNLVYRSFVKNLKSKGLRREYFDTHDLAAHYLDGNSNVDANIDRIFDRRFNERLRVQTDKQDASFVIISFADQDPAIAAQWLNQFIEFANVRTVRQMVNDVNAAILAEIKQVRYQLESALRLAAQRRQDRILDLSEALRVANALGIESATNFLVLPEKEKASIEVNTAQLPLYMRGTKALVAEIAVLESRKSDEPFIAGLRNLQEKRALLESISVERDKVSAVMVDAVGRTPYSMEKPRKKVIFMQAVVFGLLGGILLMFFAEFRSESRE